jgi:hypothetical protein
MNQKEFLTQTMVQIMEGVQEAQEQVGSALVNPPAQRDGNLVAREDQRSWRYVHKVEFDVAVTVSSGTEAKAGGNLMVAFIGG